MIAPEVLKEALALIKNVSKHCIDLVDKYISLRDVSLMTQDEVMAIAKLMKDIGIIHRRKNNQSEGLRYFREIEAVLEKKELHHCSMYLECQFGIGSTLIDLQRFDEAEERYSKFFKLSEELLKDKPDIPQLLLVASHINRARIYSVKKQNELALQDLRAAVRLLPKLPDGILIRTMTDLRKELAEILAKQEHGQDVTQKDYNNALELMYQSDNRIRYLCCELADMFVASDDLGRALSYAQSAYYINNKYEGKDILVPKRVLVLMTEIYLTQKEYANCIDAGLKLEQLLAGKPNLFSNELMDAYLDMLVSYYHLNNIKEMKELFQRTENVLSAITFKDSIFLAKYYYHYASSIHRKDHKSNWSEARKYYKKALSEARQDD